MAYRVKKVEVSPDELKREICHYFVGKLDFVLSFDLDDIKDFLKSGEEIEANNGEILNAIEGLVFSTLKIGPTNNYSVTHSDEIEMTVHIPIQ